MGCGGCKDRIKGCDVFLRGGGSDVGGCAVGVPGLWKGVVGGGMEWMEGKVPFPYGLLA